MRWFGLSCLLLLPVPVLAQTQPGLPGIVVDDTAAELTGDWQPSTHSKHYYGAGYIHDKNEGKGSKSVRFTVKVPTDAEYQVLVSYASGGGRDKAVPVSLASGARKLDVKIDQQAAPAHSSGFHPLGRVRITPDEPLTVSITNQGTTGHVIVDAVWVLTSGEFAALPKDAVGPLAKTVASPVKTPAVTAPPQPVAPTFHRQSPAHPVASLTPEQLDQMIAAGLEMEPPQQLITDEQFLRRASLDLIGRPPSLAEIQTFQADASPEKRRHLIDRLLASEEYGRNWADFWSDVIGSRQSEPELTFHDYKPFKRWLSAEFNQGSGWDQMVFSMLTAMGKVGEEPQATLIAFHQGDAHKLAGETSRAFLGMKIACAECHDHPFIDMPQETFHGMAAFFVRTDVKIAQNNSDGIEIKSALKGEHKLPGGKELVMPAVLEGDSLSAGLSDLERRESLAKWMVSGDNPWFARAFVNHAWARLMGRGFADPVDDLGEGAYLLLPEVHDAVADHLIAAQFDHRELFRLVMNTRAYQRPVQEKQVKSFAAAVSKKLRGDEVYSSLVNAIELPNFTPEPRPKTAAERFPPPPKSTRDLVNEAFGYDPSFQDVLLTRTMKQAMFLMNNVQVQQQINATPGSGTVLARLLEEQRDDARAIRHLYLRVLVREPSAKEMQILQDHIAGVQDRERAFEDILWSLLNSAEFTTRY